MIRTATASPDHAAATTSGASSPHPPLRDPILVHRHRHVDRPIHPEPRRDETLERCARAAALVRPDRRAQRLLAQPRSAADVPADRPERREPDHVAGRRDTHRVDPFAEDHADAPALAATPRAAPPPCRCGGGRRGPARRPRAPPSAPPHRRANPCPRGTARRRRPARMAGRPRRRPPRRGTEAAPPPARAPTAWCDTVGPRSAARTVPSSARRATSVFEFPPSTASSRSLTRRTARARRSATNVAPAARQAVDDRRQRIERAGRPAVEQDDGAVTHLRGPARARPPPSPALSGRAPSRRAPRRRRCRGSRAPPARSRREGHRRPRRRAPEPRPRVTPGRVEDRSLRVAHVGRQTLRRSAAASGRGRSCGSPRGASSDATRRARAGSASTHRPCRNHVDRTPAVRQHVEQPAGHPRPVRPVRVLGVERERDPERRRRLGRLGHFSTPVMTTPRVNTRWKTRNRITGISIVISVPACTYAGFR